MKWRIFWESPAGYGLCFAKAETEAEALAATRTLRPADAKVAITHEPEHA